MFGRKKGGRARPTTRYAFAEAVADGIRARRDLTHLYLMYEEGGTITVKWEASSGDRWRRFRIVANGDVDACPHCAVLTAVKTLGTALPLDDLRIARTCNEYQSVLNEWLLPCASFGRSPAVDTPLGRIPLMLPDPGWMADCHVGKGNPQTPAACTEHVVRPRR